MTSWRIVAITAVLLVSGVARARSEVLAEAEGLRLRVGNIGDAPGWITGADVDNTLQLRGLGPGLRVGTTLGPRRRAELRWQRLGLEHRYATRVPGLVLDGEQRVRRDSLDALLTQESGAIRFELGYRLLILDRSRRDETGDRFGVETFDYTSALTAHGVRAAVVFDTALVWRLRAEATLGLGMLRAQESSRTFRSDDLGPGGTPASYVFDGGRTIGMPEISARLRLHASSRFWLAVGYRAEAWWFGAPETGEFDAHGPTFALGLRLGGR